MTNVDRHINLFSSFLLKAWEIYCKYREGLSCKSLDLI